jgi:hypothetical protein
MSDANIVHTINECRGMEAQLHLILASAVSAGQWLASCSCYYNADTPPK